MSERIKFIKKKEIEGVEIESPGNDWVTWKCKVEMEPYNEYYSDWYFWFSTPIEKGQKKEVYFATGRRLYIKASEKTVDNLGNTTNTEPLFTDMQTLNKMVEHIEKMKKALLEEAK